MRGIFLTIFFLFISVLARGGQIEVCPTCPVKSVQEGIDRVDPGGTVIIHEGLYREHDIQIKRPVELIGDPNAVIDGENAGTVLSVHADSVRIKGLKIINVGQSYTKDFAGILINGSKDFVIEENLLENVFFGILIEKSSGGMVLNNKVRSNAVSQASSGNGIHLWHCSEMTIRSNEVSGLRDGIYFEFVKNSKVYGNKSQDNLRYGLHFMFSNHNAYFENEFRNNGAGVAIMFSKFVEMYQNKFVHNWGSASYGLLLKEIYDAEIEDNLFEQNTIGISVDGSTRINYRRNDFVRNGWAVKIIGACYDNVFSGNNFLNNALDLSYNSKINSNRFDGNYWSDYSGYDLDRNGIGDVPYRPVKLFSYIVHNTPETIILLRSLFVDIINFSEKVSPVFTPDNLLDNNPLMTRFND